MAPSRTPPIGVLIVDDQRMFGEALSAALVSHRGFAVTVTAGGEEAFRATEERLPDIVLVDVERARIGGVDGIRRIRRIHPATRVLVLTGHDDDLLKSQALEAGATGYLSTRTPLAELPGILRTARAGKPLLDRAETIRLLRVLHHRRHQEATERQRVNRLTPRQIQILQLIAEGAATQEIIERLGVRPSTFRTHIQSILTRLGVHRKEEALVVAIRHGVISPHRRGEAPQRA